MNELVNMLQSIDVRMQIQSLRSSAYVSIIFE